MVEVEYYIPDFGALEEFASKEKIHSWVNEWRVKTMNNEPSEAIQSWFERLKKTYGPQIESYRNCIGERGLVIADLDHLPQMGTLVGCDTYEECSK